MSRAPPQSPSPSAKTVRLSAGPLGMPLGEYETICTIGKGGYGKVKLVRSYLDDAEIACKIVSRNRKSSSAPKAQDIKRTDASAHPKAQAGAEKSARKKTTLEERILREVRLTGLLHHPNIVPLLDFRGDTSRFYLFYEYIKGKPLVERIGTRGLKDKVARKYSAQLASALDYCHSNSVVHRDIKVENILIDKEDNLRLIDFGLASFYSQDGHLRTSCGSIPYSSPEILRGTAYIGPEIDVWSYGVIVFVFVTASFPFGDPTKKRHMDKIMLGQFPNDPRLSKMVIHLLQQCLCPSPFKRPPFSLLIDHPYLQAVSGDSSRSMLSTPSSMSVSMMQSLHVGLGLQGRTAMVMPGSPYHPPSLLSGPGKQAMSHTSSTSTSTLGFHPAFRTDLVSHTASALGVSEFAVREDLHAAHILGQEELGGMSGSLQDSFHVSSNHLGRTHTRHIRYGRCPAASVYALYEDAESGATGGPITSPALSPMLLPRGPEDLTPPITRHVMDDRPLTPRHRSLLPFLSGHTFSRGQGKGKALAQRLFDLLLEHQVKRMYSTDHRRVLVAWDPQIGSDFEGIVGSQGAIILAIEVWETRAGPYKISGLSIRQTRGTVISSKVLRSHILQFLGPLGKRSKDFEAISSPTQPIDGPAGIVPADYQVQSCL